MSDKQLVLEAVSDLPESADLYRISEEISLLAAIRRGESDIEAGRIVSHDEVKRHIEDRLQQWKSPSP